MEETAIHVNQKLKEGYSIAKAERELNYGKDTLRKKLNRAGYNYDKTLKKFIFDANTVVTQNITHTEKGILEKNKSTENNINANTRYTEDSVITNSITHKTTHSKIGINNNSEIVDNATQNITHAEKPSITQNNNTHATQPRAITDDDFVILFKIIDEYKSKDQIKKTNIVIPKNDSEIITRSFRSYKSVLDSFAEYCKHNELTQKDAIAEALLLFMTQKREL